MEDIKKIVKSHKESALLIIGTSKQIENEAEEQNGGFLCMLFGTLGSSLLENMFQQGV